MPSPTSFPDQTAGLTTPGKFQEELVRMLALAQPALAPLSSSSATQPARLPCTLSVLVTDMHGLITDANQTALDLLGLQREQLLQGGVEWSTLISPSHREVHLAMLQGLRQGEPVPPAEMVYQLPGGASLTFLAGATILHGPGDRCLAYLIDISDLKRQDAERERSYAREQLARTTAESAVTHLESVLNVTDTALALLDSNDFLSEILARIRGALKADTATLWLLDEDGRHLFVGAAQGMEDEEVYRQRIPVGQGVVGKVAATRNAVNIDNLAAHEVGNLFADEQVLSVLATPLLATGKSARVIGVLSVGAKQARHFTESEAHLLELVASRASTAIERARLFEQVRSAQEQLDSLSRRVLEVQENERRQIARELHDDIGQSLTAVKIGLLALSHSPADLAEILSETLSTVDAAIARVRTLSRELRPAVLDDLGLAAALRWLTKGHAQEGPVCHVEAPEESRFSVLIETVCFRVAQEALTNALRHASASNIWITLQLSKGTLTLVIEDDGVGFDVDAAQERIRQGDSLGLLNMEERVRLGAGRFHLFSRPGRGTKIRAVFSLKALATEDYSPPAPPPGGAS